MFWTFVSPKGGVGVSTVAAAVAVTLATDREVTILDLAGDQPDIFGLDATAPTGVWDWLGAGHDVGVDALANLELEVRPGLTILPAGSRAAGSQVTAGRCRQLATGLSDGRLLIGDLGVLDADPFSTAPLLAASSDRTTLIIRACYLALRRARRIPIAVDDVVEISEGGRALATIDIEAVLGHEVSARLALDPRVARSIDSGITAVRMPRALRRLVEDLESPEHRRRAREYEVGR